MTGIIIFIHTIICIFLTIVILMQSGRGGGLTEGFAPAESLFGAKTNTMMIKATTVLATVFLVTCLSLAYLSSQKDKSLMSGVTSESEQAGDGALGIPLDESGTNANVDVTKEVNENTIQDNMQAPPAPENTGELPANP